VRPLLAVDGDSFAHRAYHALPRSIRRAGGRPGNLLVGLANMISGLWEAERPRAVVVGWDSLGHPTYRNEAFAGYQAGREFEEGLLEQLDIAPDLLASFGFVCAKAPGYEADDFLAAAVAVCDGPVLVATSDRDAFQLASPRVTILKPVRGISQIERIGPAEVRERYGVEPEQVADFIALRGDPSDGLPGAKGIGEKRAADILRRHGTLEAALAEAESDGPEVNSLARQADELRAFREIAALRPVDVKRPADAPTDRAGGAAAAREIGMNRLADRLAEAA
jgi:DNA polymerase-1